MIDLHNHIIPNLDDGSRSLEISLSMLQHAAGQGITDVVNTVHYQCPRMDGKRIEFDLVKDKIEKLQAELKKQGWELQKSTQPGKKLTEGAIVDIVIRHPDPNLPEGVQIVHRVISPGIMKDGKLVKKAEIETRYGTKPAKEEAPIKEKENLIN